MWDLNPDVTAELKRGTLQLSGNKRDPGAHPLSPQLHASLCSALSLPDFHPQPSPGIGGGLI